MLVLLGGCGRIGFGVLASHGDDDGDGGVTGDAGMIPDGGMACVQGTMINVSQTTGASGDPTLAWDGNSLGVTWIEDPASTEIGMFRITTLAGALQPSQTLGPLSTGEHDISITTQVPGTFKLGLGQMAGGHRQAYRSTNGAAPVAITSGGKDNFRPRAVSLPGGSTAYVFEQTVGSSMYQAMLDVVDASDTITTSDVMVMSNLALPYVMDADFDGTNLVGFAFTGTMSSGAITMQRFTTSGVAVGVPKTIATTTASVSNVGVVWAGDRHLVTWNAASYVNIVYVDTQGAKLSPIVQTGSGPFGFFAQPFAGATSDLVAWTDVATSITYIVPMKRDGSAGGELTLPNTTDVTAIWVGTDWAIATASAGEIQVTQLCP